MPAKQLIGLIQSRQKAKYDGHLWVLYRFVFLATQINALKKFRRFSRNGRNKLLKDRTPKSTDIVCETSAFFSRQIKFSMKDTPRGLKVQIRIYRVGQKRGKQKSIPLGFKGMELERTRKHRWATAPMV